MIIKKLKMHFPYLKCFVASKICPLLKEFRPIRTKLIKAWGDLT